IGIPVEKVKFELGSSDLPFGPVAGGSQTTGTVGSAITVAAENLRKKLTKVGGADASKSDLLQILMRSQLKSVEADGKFEHEENKKLGFQSFGAHFCEVKIDPDLPLVRVTRWVSVMNCGRVINPKTGGS